MLDIKFIRENKDIVQAGAKKKRVEIDIEKLIALDDERLKELKEVEDLRAGGWIEFPTTSREFQDPALKVQLIEEMRRGERRYQGERREIKKTTTLEWQKLMIQVPKCAGYSVPDGATDAIIRNKSLGRNSKVWFYTQRSYWTYAEFKNDWYWARCKSCRFSRIFFWRVMELYCSLPYGNLCKISFWKKKVLFRWLCRLYWKRELF